MAMAQTLANPPKGLPADCIVLRADQIKEAGYYWMLGRGGWDVLRLTPCYSNPMEFEFQWAGTDEICLANEFAGCYFIGPLTPPA